MLYCTLVDGKGVHIEIDGFTPVLYAKLKNKGPQTGPQNGPLNGPQNGSILEQLQVQVRVQVQLQVQLQRVQVQLQVHEAQFLEAIKATLGRWVA